MTSLLGRWSPKSSSERIGANTGSTMSVISIQSKKKPRKNTTAIRIIRIHQGLVPTE